MNTATIRLTFPDATAAETAKRALEPDSGGFLASLVEGEVLVLSAEADAIMGLLRTLDDALGCLRATGMD